MQRIFDILFSTLALLVLSPLLIPICLALRLSGEGEIFYYQDRVGQNGRSFRLFKFATMLKNSPSIGTGTVTVKNDPRVLPVGRILRGTKINELPQLLNILLGDMSVIGPRPLTPQGFSAYSPETRTIIEKVHPGLSGIGSIIFRSEEAILAEVDGSVDFHRDVITPYKGELEKWYVKNYSLTNYFKAILVTLVVVMLPESSLPWRVFRGLPAPPNNLRAKLHYIAR